jgi:hypothetical protein
LLGTKTNRFGRDLACIKAPLRWIILARECRDSLRPCHGIRSAGDCLLPQHEGPAPLAEVVALFSIAVMVKLNPRRLLRLNLLPGDRPKSASAKNRSRDVGEIASTRSRFR